MASSGMAVPELEVWLSGREPFTVRIDQAAQVQWDLERAKRRWPAMDEAQALWSTYVSWSAARKTSAINRDMPFDVYAESIERIDLVRAEDADPTRAEAVPD